MSNTKNNNSDNNNENYLNKGKQAVSGAYHKTKQWAKDDKTKRRAAHVASFALGALASAATFYATGRLK